MLNEIWRDIEEFPGYQVSSKGKVRNSKGLILSSFVQNSGYEVVSLHLKNDRTSYKRTVHRLVAIAFLPSDNPELIVNHIDGIKLNNEASNLEWCTNSENILHARRTGLNPYNKPTQGKKLAPRGSGVGSKYLGVAFDKSRGKWRACVVYDN